MNTHCNAMEFFKVPQSDLSTLLTVLAKAVDKPNARLSKAKLESLFHPEHADLCFSILSQSGFTASNDSFDLVDHTQLAASLTTLKQHLSSSIPFSEVCRLIEQGLEVPGIVEVTPFPTSEFSFSKSIPPRKPWERESC